VARSFSWRCGGEGAWGGGLGAPPLRLPSRGPRAAIAGGERVISRPAADPAITNLHHLPQLSQLLGGGGVELRKLPQLRAEMRRVVSAGARRRVAPLVRRYARDSRIIRPFPLTVPVIRLETVSRDSTDAQSPLMALSPSSSAALPPRVAVRGAPGTVWLVLRPTRHLLSGARTTAERGTRTYLFSRLRPRPPPRDRADAQRRRRASLPRRRAPGRRGPCPGASSLAASSVRLHAPQRR